jgi:DNA-binding response OmpR family regulator
MAILVVEDDPDLLDILCFALRREGHDVIAARDGETGLEMWKAKEPLLVVLDVDLPKKTGWEVCKEIRKESNTPVVMLTAAGDEADIVRGFGLGADDYVTKPFSHKQLVLRIGAILRRAKQNPDQPRKGWQVMNAGDLRLDPQWRTVYRGDQAIRLTPMEFKLLYELVLHAGQVLPHQILTDRVWGYEGVDDTSLLKGHIRNLRRKLEIDSSSPVYIRTVAGIGYTFSSQTEDAELAGRSEAKHRQGSDRESRPDHDSVPTEGVSV